MFSFLAPLFLKNLHIFAVVGVVGFLAWGQFHTIPSLKNKIEATTTQLAEVKAANEQMRVDFDTYKENQKHINEILSAKSTLVSTQSKLKASMHEIPVQNVEKPFSDTGLLARAGKLREYQEGSPINRFE